MFARTYGFKSHQPHHFNNYGVIAQLVQNLSLEFEGNHISPVITRVYEIDRLTQKIEKIAENRLTKS